MRTLLIVSGGDAPGINAALHRFATLADRNGDQVVGARGGVAGAVNGHLIDLRPDLLATVVGLGGSFLASSREPVLSDPLNRVRLIETIARQQIDNIVLFGGDGSLRAIPPILADMGLACIGIPTTIDNDVPGSADTIGFDTACNAAASVIDGLVMTARALPGRIFSVETLGGSTGFLALEIAYIANAQAVLLPEYAYETDWLVARLQAGVQRDQMALVVLSEGVATSRSLVDELQQDYDLRVRDTRLGHGQRGANPTHHDRLLALRMMDLAYAALRQGCTRGTTMVQQHCLKLVEEPVSDLPPKQPDQQLYVQINGLA